MKPDTQFTVEEISGKENSLVRYLLLISIFWVWREIWEKQISKAERNYCITKEEFLAILKNIFRNICMTWSNVKTQKTNRQMAQQLQEFNCKIEHEAAKKHIGTCRNHWSIVVKKKMEKLWNWNSSTDVAKPFLERYSGNRYLCQQVAWRYCRTKSSSANFFRGSYDHLISQFGSNFEIEADILNQKFLEKYVTY